MRSCRGREWGHGVRRLGGAGREAWWSEQRGEEHGEVGAGSEEAGARVRKGLEAGCEQRGWRRLDCRMEEHQRPKAELELWEGVSGGSL